MKRSIHELSEREKRQVADELMMSTGVFGALLIAGVICLAVLLRPSAPASVAERVVAVASAAL